MSQVGRVTVVG